MKKLLYLILLFNLRNIKADIWRCPGDSTDFSEQQAKIVCGTSASLYSLRK